METNLRTDITHYEELLNECGLTKLRHGKETEDRRKGWEDWLLESIHSPRVPLELYGITYLLIVCALVVLICLIKDRIDKYLVRAGNTQNSRYRLSKRQWLPCPMNMLLGWQSQVGSLRQSG